MVVLSKGPTVVVVTSAASVVTAWNWLQYHQHPSKMLSAKAFVILVDDQDTHVHTHTNVHTNVLLGLISTQTDPIKQKQGADSVCLLISGIGPLQVYWSHPLFSNTFVFFDSVLLSVNPTRDPIFPVAACARASKHAHFLDWSTSPRLSRKSPNFLFSVELTAASQMSHVACVVQVQQMFRCCCFKWMFEFFSKLVSEGVGSGSDWGR